MKIKHVYGNVLKVDIPLTIKIHTLIDGHDSEHKEDFYPDPGKSCIIELISGSSSKYSFNASINGNVVHFEDDGKIRPGLYGVSVKCFDSEGKPYRYYEHNVIHIVYATIDAGIEAGVEFNAETYTLEGVVFVSYGGGSFVQADWTEDDTHSKAYIKNKPTIPSVPTNVSSFNNDSGYITKSVDDLENYYNKTETNTLLEEKADNATVSSLDTKIDNVKNNISIITNLISESNPARKDGSSSPTGYHKGYSVDVSDLYSKGYVAVMFRGCNNYSSSNANAIVPGIITKEVETVDVAESYIDNVTTPDYDVDWYILPVTTDSKKLWVTIGKTGNPRTQQIITPACVFALNQKELDAITAGKSLDKIFVEIAKIGEKRYQKTTVGHNFLIKNAGPLPVGTIIKNDSAKSISVYDEYNETYADADASGIAYYIKAGETWVADVPVYQLRSVGAGDFDFTIYAKDTLSYEIKELELHVNRQDEKVDYSYDNINGYDEKNINEPLTVGKYWSYTTHKRSKVSGFVSNDVTSCKEGDVFIITGTGGSGLSRLYVFTDADGNNIDGAVAEANEALEDYTLVAPEGAARFYFSARTMYPYKLQKQSSYEGILNELAELRSDIEESVDNSGHSVSRMFNVPLNLKKPNLKILDLGNSYTGDAIHYLTNILNAAGITTGFSLYDCIRGGSCFRDWVNMYKETDDANYSVNKVSGDKINGITTGANSGLDNSWFVSLLKNDWDIIIIHQESKHSANYDGWTSEGDAGGLTEYLRILKTYCPQATIGFYIVHSYPSWKSSSYQSGADSTERWQNIAKSVEHLKADYGIDFIIPYGTAVQNLRMTSLNGTDPVDNTKKNDFSSDGIHLTSGIGDYVAACAYFEALFAPRYDVTVLGNTYTDTNVPVPQPGDSGYYDGRGVPVQISSANALLAQKAAVLAVNDMFNLHNPEIEGFIPVNTDTKVVYTGDGNPSGFITKSVDDLTNYYLKSETYTKAEVAALIGAIQQFHYEIYASTSEVTAPASNVLYLIGPASISGSDKYEEYVYANNTFVKIGDTTLDLSQYSTTSEMNTAINTALADYTTTANLTTLLTGKQDVIQDLATIRSGANKGSTAYQKPIGGIPLSDIEDGVIPDVSGKEDSSNKVTNLSQQSTDTQYPSAKAVYDFVKEEIGKERERVVITATANTGDVSEDAVITVKVDNVVVNTGTGALTLDVEYGKQYVVECSRVYDYLTPAAQTFTAGQSVRNVTCAYTYIARDVITIDQTETDESSMVTGDVQGDVIKAIRSSSHLYLGTQTETGNQLICQLKDDDGTKYADGTTAAMNGTEGDQWLKLPVFWWKVIPVGTAASDGSYDSYSFAFAFAGEPDPSWHKWEGDKNLLGAKKMYVTGGKGYSRSGIHGSANFTQAQGNSYASARGTGYRCVTWEWQWMMCILFYAWYGRMNSQAQCGSGSNINTRTLGTKDSLGMTDTTSSNGNADNTKFWGIENWWGDLSEWIGNITSNNYVVTITDMNTGQSRQVSGWLQFDGTGGYASRFKVTQQLDFIPRAKNGTETTCYCDWVNGNTGSCVVSRSYFNAGPNGGVAYVSSFNDPSNTSAYVGSRLAFNGVITEAESVAAYKAALEA